VSGGGGSGRFTEKGIFSASVFDRIGTEFVV
jgi:hypothetical protein